MTNKTTQLIELNNSIENPNSRFNHAEERISDLEGRTFEIIQSEEQKEKKNEKELIKPIGLRGHY